jgi:hypothetical protein
MTTSSTEIFDVAREARAKALVTRDQGRVLVSRAEDILSREPHITVELGSAEALSPSFADEFFGALAEHLGSSQFRLRVRVRCPNEAWQVLIRKVLGHRRTRWKKDVRTESSVV